MVMASHIDALSWEMALARISRWTAERESRYVCLCNVHSVVTGSRDAQLREAINRADMACADGMPVAVALRLAGFAGQQRINGPDLMWKYCARSASTGQSIFLYGSTPQTLDKLAARLLASFPTLRIAGMYSPPFRAATEEEDDTEVSMINNSGAHVVFVGLGCPKQELWMAAHRGKINAVMIGVGAAFDYHAGTVKRAPAWMRNVGLEWLHRLLSEPRRLWRRYLVTNSIFLLHMAGRLLARKPRNRHEF